MFIQLLALSIAGKLDSAAGASDYRISKDGNLYLKTTVEGIEFLAHLPANTILDTSNMPAQELEPITEDTLRQRLPRIAQTIAKLNAWIPDARLRVHTVFCTEKMNELVHIDAADKPAILLTRFTKLVNPDVAAHETGHAVLWPYEKQQVPQPKLIRALHCIWTRLGETRRIPVTIDGEPYVSSVAGFEQPDRAVGHLLFDPSRWSPESKRIEHPWDDFSEIFTSAFEAYNVAPMGLMSSLEWAKREDEHVFPHADDLIAILEAMNPERGNDPAALNTILDTVLGRQVETVLGIQGCPDEAPTLDPPTPLELKGDTQPNEYDYLLNPSLLLRDRGQRLD